MRIARNQVSPSDGENVAAADEEQTGALDPESSPASGSQRPPARPPARLPPLGGAPAGVGGMVKAVGWQPGTDMPTGGTATVSSFSFAIGQDGKGTANFVFEDMLDRPLSPTATRGRTRSTLGDMSIHAHSTENTAYAHVEEGYTGKSHFTEHEHGDGAPIQPARATPPPVFWG